MKRKFLLLLTLFMMVVPFSVLQSQNLSKYYIHHAQEGGDLYFVYPFEAFKNSSDGSDFVYDITYRQGFDSATINYTYFTAEPVVIDSVIIVSGKNLIRSKTSKIYQDFKKHQWENRFSFRITFEALETVINNKSTPTFHLISEDKKMEFKVKEKKWETYADALSKILYIIKSQ